MIISNIVSTKKKLLPICLKNYGSNGNYETHLFRDDKTNKLFVFSVGEVFLALQRRFGLFQALS